MHLNLIKEKEKYNGVLTPRFIGKNCFQVMELLTFFGKRIFMSFALPKHTPNGNHTTCVRVGACVGVHHYSVHCPLHWP